MSSKRSAVVTALVVLGFCVAAGWRLHARQQAHQQTALFLPAPPRPAAAAPASGPPQPAQVIADLFGPQAAGPATAADERTTLWHRQPFRLGGHPALAVFTETRRIDPRTQQPVDAHAQAPSISAAAYEFVGGKWKLAGATRDFARIVAWGDAPRPGAPIDVLAFPGGGAAFLVEHTGGGQGYTQVGRSVWAFEQGQWRDLGFIETGGNNEGAARAGQARYSFSGSISVLPGTSTHPDLLVKRHGTIVDAHDHVVPAPDTRYVFTGRSYEELLPGR